MKWVTLAFSKKAPLSKMFLNSATGSPTSLHLFSIIFVSTSSFPLRRRTTRSRRPGVSPPTPGDSKRLFTGITSPSTSALKYLCIVVIARSVVWKFVIYFKKVYTVDQFKNPCTPNYTTYIQVEVSIYCCCLLAKRRVHSIVGIFVNLEVVIAMVCYT